MAFKLFIDNLFNYRKIQFWIIIFFVIRIIGITNPPLEIGHNWRQVTGLMVTRNFLDVDNNIFYPRIDDNNGESGIIGMEFPFMNYLMYIFSLIFGYSHWYGRLINLIISSFGIYFFYLLVVRFLNKRIAFIATLILLSSIWFSFSRKTMPDTFCISLIFIGLYYGVEFFTVGCYKYFICFVLFTGLGILSKISAGIYLPLFVVYLLLQKSNKERKIYLILSSGFILCLVYLWYFVWNPQLSLLYGNWYNSGKSIIVGFNEILLNLQPTIKQFYFHAFSGYILFAFFFIGLLVVLIKWEKNILFVLSLVFIPFLVYIFKSGFYFYHHNYYIIPIVPVMSVLAAYSVTLIRNKYVYVLIITLGIIEAISNQQHDFFIKNSEKYKLDLQLIADGITKADDLIAINGNGNPQMIYLTHRKGWNCYNNQLNDDSYLSEIALQGCKFIFISKHLTNILLPEKLVYTDENFDVYELQ